MSHGTSPGQRAPGSKTGRNKRKCERYASQDRRIKNNPTRKPRPNNRTPH